MASPGSLNTMLVVTVTGSSLKEMWPKAALWVIKKFVLSEWKNLKIFGRRPSASLNLQDKLQGWLSRFRCQM